MHVDSVNQPGCVHLQKAERYPPHLAERVIHDNDRITDKHRFILLSTRKHKSHRRLQLILYCNLFIIDRNYVLLKCF